MTDTQADTHTPGPWRTDPCFPADIQTADGKYEICTVDGDSQNYAADCPHGFPTPDAKTAHANARLIAAAPDLLAALQALVQAAPVAWLGGAWGIARAAIARATGGA